MLINTAFPTDRMASRRYDSVQQIFGERYKEKKGTKCNYFLNFLANTK
jgi:hypothetical protein